MLWILSAVVGYLLGRVGHRWLNVWIKNPRWVPHHWLYGLVLAVAGGFSSEAWLFCVGVGLFISDLRDAAKLYVFRPDAPQDGFWGFD